MDELDLELERDKQRPVEVVKKGGWLGKIVALLLGIILGFVGCFGAIAAVVYYFIGVMKIEEGAGYLKGVLGDDFDYTDYIAGEYGDKTTLELILSTTTAAQSVLDGTGTLNTLNDIYPFLYTVVAGAEDADPNAAFNGIVPMLKQYGLELDAAVMMSLIVNGTGGEVLQPDKYLTDYVLDNAYDLAIGDLLQIVPFPASPIIDALFYGQEGVDYVVNADGLKEPVQGGTPWLTIEGLLFAEGDVIGERINAITLDAVISVPENNDIMKALAYGSSSHYEYVNGEAVMNQQTYTFDGTHLYDDDGEKVDGVVAPLANGIYSLTQDDKTLYLKADENGNYLAYTDQACTNAALYKKTTIGDLSGNTDSLINNIELGSTLNVTPSSNKVLLALAYGTEGEDYDVVNGEIKMRDGKKKRTIGDLTNGGDELIENIRLADVMETDTGDAIMMYLLYGKKDVHYELVNGEPVLKQKQIAVLEHNGAKLPYNVYGDTRLNGTTDGATYTVNGITYYLSPVLSEDTTVTPAVQKTVAIKEEDHTDVSGNAALYYVFEDEAKTIPVKFEPTSLGELMNDSSIISNLTNRLTLVEVMGESALKDTPMEKLGQYVIDDVPKQIDTLTMQDIYKPGDVENNKVLKYLYYAIDKDTKKPYPITNLGGAVENMAIIDVLEINDNPILKSLAYNEEGKPVLINDMNERLDTLTVGDVFGDDMYKKNDQGEYVDKDGNVLVDQTDTSKYVVSNRIVYSLRETKITELDGKINELTVDDVFGDDIYEKADDGDGYKKVVDGEGNPIKDENDDYVYVIKDGANPVLAHLKDTPIADMSSAINDLEVGDILKDDIYNEDGTVKADANPVLVHLKDTKVTDMANAVDDMKVGDIFKDDIYEEDGTTVKADANPVLAHLKDTPVTDMAGAVDDMKVGDIFKDDIYEEDGTTVKADANPVLVHLKDTPVTDMAGAVDDMKVGDIFKDDIYKEDGTTVKDDANPVLVHLKDTPVTDMAGAVDDMTLGDIFKDDIYKEDGTTVKDDANPVLVHLKDTKVTALATEIDTMTVGDIFGDEIYKKDPVTGEYIPDTETADPNDYLVSTSANHVLVALHDKKISELSTAMNELYVGDLFVHEIYLEAADGDHFVPDSSERAGYKLDPDANPILVALRDCEIDKMSAEVENMTVGEIFKNDIYETDGTTVKGSWHYLLKDSRKTINGVTNPQYGQVHDDYKLTSEMNVMMENMSANMETATLEELNQMGIINLSGNETLLSREESGEIQYNLVLTTIDKYYYEDGTTEKHYFCELTVSQLFDYVGKLIAAI